MKYFLLLFGLLIYATTSIAQANPSEAEAKFKKEYNERIKKERLYGIYIPKDMADAFVQLNKLTAQESIMKFKMATEDAAVKKLHFSLGRWLIHNWGFYGGSRFSHYIKELGITHPDDQAKFVIRSYHRYLNKKPLDVEAQITAVLEAQKKKVEERQKNSTILHTETRKRVN